MTRPMPTGKYAVGTVTYSVMNDREEVLRPGTKRSISARVYYPTRKDSAAGLEKALYMSRNMFQGLKNGFKLPMNYDKKTAAGENTSECYTDAPRIEGERFPLIIFNHGYQSFREGNSFLCIELASQGYVVITVGHPLEGLCTEYDDGTCIFGDQKLLTAANKPFISNIIALKKLAKLKGTDEENAKAFDAYQDKFGTFMKQRLPEWAKDVYAVVDHAKNHLSDLIDFESGIGLTGHSFGGATAYYLCMRDPQFVCGVNIDGGLFGDYSGCVMEKPFMQVTSETNERVVARGYLQHTKPAYKVVFRDMKHVGFSDMKHAIRMGSMVGKLPADDMHNNLCKCHVEFFDTYLKKAKNAPELETNDVMRYTVYEPDV
ncbi:MAG: hypothetical protein J6Q02_08640 [Lachnospiraceae bacterium]|nr:hypothetical protein [Lachnospiraceae bacterium]